MIPLIEQIEMFINQLLQDDDEAELQRNKLAARFNCSPSQINYVLSTRFTNQRGYIIESRRGGGGYVRIIRIKDDLDSLLYDIATSASNMIRTCADANAMIARLYAAGVISGDCAVAMKAAVSDEALSGVPEDKRSLARQGIFQAMALALAREG